MTQLTAGGPDQLTAFQAVVADNHPIHYNVEYARSHGHSAPVVYGRQVLAFTAPGATLFRQYIDDVFIAFASVSCKFLAEVHAGDTLYPQLEIIDFLCYNPRASCQRYSGTQHGRRSRPVTLKAAAPTTTKDGQALHRLHRAVQHRCRPRDRHPSSRRLIVSDLARPRPSPTCHRRWRTVEHYRFRPNLARRPDLSQRTYPAERLSECRDTGVTSTAATEARVIARRSGSTLPADYRRISESQHWLGGRSSADRSLLAQIQLTSLPQGTSSESATTLPVDFWIFVRMQNSRVARRSVDGPPGRPPLIAPPASRPNQAQPGSARSSVTPQLGCWQDLCCRSD